MSEILIHCFWSVTSSGINRVVDLKFINIVVIQMLIHEVRRWHWYRLCVFCACFMVRMSDAEGWEKEWITCITCISKVIFAPCFFYGLCTLANCFVSIFYIFWNVPWHTNINMVLQFYSFSIVKGTKIKFGVKILSIQCFVVQNLYIAFCRTMLQCREYWHIMQSY